MVVQSRPGFIPRLAGAGRGKGAGAPGGGPSNDDAAPGRPWGRQACTAPAAPAMRSPISAGSGWWMTLEPADLLVEAERVVVVVLVQDLP